ncbi:MAG: NAD(P)H-hydrate dehydratase [Candidatus Micrarchaeota archaeon]|nr:NAD(P)H-hydrate dehydratase [Candidatus Micrarchaeota archaeon]
MGIEVMRIKLPKRGNRKGLNGRILVIGGSDRYFGSPALVAMAAMRSGADLAYILAPEFVAPTIASYSPNLIVWSYPGKKLSKLARKVVAELHDRVDVLVIGNGLTKEKEVLAEIKKIIETWEKPIIIDADAIGVKAKPKSKNAFYTPHAVEFKRLTGSPPSPNLEKRKKQVFAAAKKLNATIILKGEVDVVSDGRRIATNTTGNVGMTCGGTGDSLAGVLAAFVARGIGPIEAASLSAYVNGLAGDIALKEIGAYSLVATDVIEKIPAALRKLK